MTKYSPIAYCLIFLGLTLSCISKEDNSPATTGQLYFHFHGDIETTEIPVLDTVMYSNAGRKISLSFTQLYISNIKLVKLDGSLYSVPNKVLLRTFWNELYLIGNVPAGNYKSVQFLVGFDSLTAAKNPISTDTVFNHHEMWFESTANPAGYVFLNLQGKIDTTIASNAQVNQMVPFTYKIGTFANAKAVSLPDENFIVLPNKTQYVHMIINYMKLFDGIDLTKPGNLAVQNISDNSNAVAKQIANNIPAMFSYEF